MTAVVEDEGTQDWVAGYNREGTTVANNATDSGVATMMSSSGLVDLSSKIVSHKKGAMMKADGISRVWLGSSVGGTVGLSCGCVPVAAAAPPLSNLVLPQPP